MYKHSEDNIQNIRCRTICQNVCRVSRKWMESKFLDQDVDVVSLTNKGIVIRCFVSRNYNKILMETRKPTGNISVTKNGLGYGVDRMFQLSDSAFTTSPIDLSIRKECRHPFSWSIAYTCTCKGPWVLHSYHVLSKFIKRLWRKSWKCGKFTDGRRMPDDIRRAMTIAQSILRLRWAKTGLFKHFLHRHEIIYIYIVFHHLFFPKRRV